MSRQRQLKSHPYLMNKEASIDKARRTIEEEGRAGLDMATSKPCTSSLSWIWIQRLPVASTTARTSSWKVESFRGELLYALVIVPEPDGVQQGSVLVEDGCLTHPSMDIYSHILHGCRLMGGLRAARSYGVSRDQSGSRSGFGPV